MKNLHHRMKMFVIGAVIISAMFLFASWGSMKAVEISKPITNALHKN